MARYVGDWGKALLAWFYLTIILAVLAIWKLVDIGIWIVSHITVGWS